MKNKNKSITLKDVFAAMGQAPESVIAKDAVDPVLNLDHARAMVKRFAVQDATIYRIFVGKRQCPDPDLAAYFNEVQNPMTARYHASMHYYRKIYKKSEPVLVQERNIISALDEGDTIPAIRLNKTSLLICDQGSGYKNTRYLIKLIQNALECRMMLGTAFALPLASARYRVENLVEALDKTQRARFPIFEDEATALKNLALPSNPLDSRLSFWVSGLVDLYEDEFNRAQYAALPKAPPSPPPPPPSRLSRG